MRLPVRRLRPSIRRFNLTHAPRSTVAASKAEIASSESVRGRATTTVEDGSGLERTKRRRASGHCPPPDARTRAGVLNASDVSHLTHGSRAIGNQLLSHRSFCSFPTERPRVCQDARKENGTSNRDPLETPKVSAPDIGILRSARPSTEQGPFPGTSRASTDNTTTAPPDPPPYRTSVRPQNQHKAAGRAGHRSTRNHHRAIEMGRLEAMPYGSLE